MKEPETYEELIRYKHCVDLAKYYELSEDNLKLVYDFLTLYKDGEVSGGTDTITLTLNNEVKEVIKTNLIDNSIAGLSMNNIYFSTILPYVSNSYSGTSGGFGGGSSNNNNNNNNNNNRV